MKRKFWIAVALSLVGGVAFAAVEKIDRNPSAYPVQFISGIYIGNESSANGVSGDTTNRIGRSYGGCATLDIASTGTLACTTTTLLTRKGAVAGDPCILGLPATHPTNGSGSFNCVVSAADTIAVRFCNPSAGSLDPSSVTYCVRTFGP